MTPVARLRGSLRAGRPPRPLTSVGLACLALLGLVTVAEAAQARPESQGRLVALDADAGTATLDHGTIPGLLPAGRTTFPVSAPALLDGLRLGDRVRFAVEASEASHGLVTLTDIQPDSPTPGEAAWRGRPLALVALAAGIATVVLLAATVHVLRRRLRGVRAQLRELTLGQEALRRDLEQVTRTLAHVALSLRGRSQVLRERLEIIRAADAAGPAEAGRRYVLVMRRGAPDPRRTLWRGPGGPDIARMVVDRRFAERRRGRGAVAPERRHAERRRPAPPSWVTSGFLLVPVPDALLPGGARPPAGARAAGEPAPR